MSNICEFLLSFFFFNKNKLKEFIYDDDDKTDLQRLNTFVQQIAPFGESGLQSLNIGEYIKRVGTSLGVDMDGLIKDEQQMAMEQQQAQEEQLQSQVAGSVAKEGMGMARDAAKGDQQAQIEQAKENN